MNIALKPSESYIGYPSITFLGQRIDNFGLNISADKFEIIKTIYRFDQLFTQLYTVLYSINKMFTKAQNGVIAQPKTMPQKHNPDHAN